MSGHSFRHSVVPRLMFPSRAICHRGALRASLMAFVDSADAPWTMWTQTRLTFESAGAFVHA